MECRLFKIEVTNPFDRSIECYVIAAKNELMARYAFSKEYPSYKVVKTILIERNILKIEV